MSKRMIRIFDTTLRDGEQSPGASMNLAEKMEVAQALVELGVDVARVDNEVVPCARLAPKLLVKRALIR